MTTRSIVDADEIEDDLTPPKGVATLEWMREAWRKATLARKGMLALTDKVTELQGEVDTVKGVVMRIDANIVDIKTDVRRATTPPPPMRDKVDTLSTIDVHEMARKVAAAAIEGERRSDTTPDEQVARVVEELEAKRELAKLRKSAADRAKSTRKTIEAVVAVLASTGLIELARILLMHH